MYLQTIFLLYPDWLRNCVDSDEIFLRAKNSAHFCMFPNMFRKGRIENATPKLYKKKK